MAEPEWSVETTVSQLSLAHPAAMLFLGRHYTGEAGATGARMRFVEPDRIVVEVETAHGRAAAQLMFAPPVRSAAEVRAVVGWLLREVRAAHPEAPVTPLESRSD